jgi:hypothetical protein
MEGSEPMIDTNEVRPLNPRHLKWRARRKLRRVRREGRTGMLAYSYVPSTNRNGYRYYRSVHIREGQREVCIGKPDYRSVRWVDLAPGRHLLSFVVSNSGKDVSFTREFTLGPRQIIAAWCYTTYSLKPFNRHPRPNRWYIGVLDGASGELVSGQDGPAAG